MPLRVSEREEGTGLDVAQHGEEAYVQGDGAILISPEAGFAFERLVGAAVSCAARPAGA